MGSLHLSTLRVLKFRSCNVKGFNYIKYYVVNVSLGGSDARARESACAQKQCCNIPTTSECRINLTIAIKVRVFPPPAQHFEAKRQKQPPR